MSQLHKRYTDEQIKVLFEGYCQGKMKETRPGLLKRLRLPIDYLTYFKLLRKNYRLFH